MERGISSHLRETLSSDQRIIPDWDYKYCELAKHISRWSKDPSTCVGAVTVGHSGQILSQGYNGFPRGIRDSSKRLADKQEKYKYMVHAEMNCIYNASLNGVSLNESTLYVYGLPVCSECAKGVIQVGVKKIIIYTPEISLNEFEGRWLDSFAITKNMFDEVNLEYHWYDSRCI